MVLPRPATRCFKAPSRLLLRRTKTPLQPSIWQKSNRRKYSSAAGADDHGAHKKSSEIPWLIGSLAVFLPSAWYLAQPQLNKKPHGDGHWHGSHESGDDHGDEPKGDDGGEESSGGDDGGKSEDSDGGESEPKSEDGGDSGKQEEAGSKDSGDDAEKDANDAPRDDQDDEGDKEKPEKKDREHRVTKEKGNSEKIDGVKFKGPTLAGEDGQQTHTEKHVPDHKGFNKKRLESHYGTVLGQAEDDEQSADGKDLGAASKTPGDFHTMSGKQEGLANTDTKHSTDITKNPDKSKKGDGSAETSKQKGTVDVNRKLG